MAQEIVFNYGLSVKKNGLNFRYPQSEIKVDQSGSNVFSNVQLVPSTGEVPLDIGNSAFVPGYSAFTNLSTTSGSYIGIGRKPSGVWDELFYLGYQQPGMIPLATVSGWYVFAHLAGSGLAIASGHVNSGLRLGYNIIER